MSTAPLKADLRHVTYALSDALDLVGLNDVGHGKRVGIVAYACARQKGMSEAEATFLFDLGLLHDIGVSSTEVHRSLLAEFDWVGSPLHCEIGYQLLQAFPPLAALAVPVKYHHTRWDQVPTSGVGPMQAWQANLIFLADRVDALAAPFHGAGTVLLHTGEIRALIQQRSGTFFAPELVELFLEASRSEAFWLRLEPRSVQTFIQDILDQGASYEASMGDLRQLAEIFSRIVDAKSPFTAEHSLGVAGLARLLAERSGLSADSCAKIEIAGLLHDVGKLRVPDGILDKPGALDQQERQIINTHSFETYQILRHIKGFEEITPWAAYHHEEPGGSGYPFRLDGRTLPIEARLLRVADIFQAMVQDRPYRKGLDREQALGFLEHLVAAGRLEPELVSLVAACGEEAMIAAQPGLRTSAG
ncbi:HD domain-containing phosphohydrolase [Geothrix sp.]|jgi:putative nucleotidyltransferase with HDIG domain|uniref:HD-GYP domain-containing protein n=1 Tax=Geothrix sp. TaxID=1962974 RepID=UPI0025C5032B|nr:HD domain-containing phosphohydrolase [Geothrix sp.]